MSQIERDMAADAVALSKEHADRADRYEALLRDAEDALHSFALCAIVVSPRLEVPYTDAPEQSPWSYILGPQARRAHDLAREIRTCLGLPYRSPTRALGTPPLTLDDVLREYDRLRSEPPPAPGGEREDESTAKQTVEHEGGRS